jgi:hypothetical protein|uniref:DUF4838 domain-containing protein n=1 Tax=Prosthecobacter sp. TaxID=1965333 RepID=UPI0037832A96
MKLFVLLFLTLAHLGTAHADITLVREGKAQAVIIVPEGLSKHVQKSAAQLTGGAMSVPLAAVELADYLRKVSGARPVIATETQKGVEAASRIYIGHCKANADLAVQPEEFVVRTKGKDLHICGGDAGPGGMICQGTLYGVYDFIERELGVRWLFPGEHGEVVPRRSTITIPDLDRHEQPRIEKRKVRNQAVTREDTFAPVLKQWGIAMEAWKAAQGPEATGAWFRRMRLGARIEIEGGHAYAGWWEKYGKEHPEWFALQPDGTRTQQPVRERLCKSNPALWDEIARVRIAEFQADPSKRMASLAPNDGGANKWCMCAACRALDPADAPKLLNDRSLIDPATKLPFAEYPALTDRVFTFFNEIAKRVRREMPDRDLVAYAYSVYRTPPVKLGPLEPNLIIGYVGLDPADIKAWSRIAPRLYLRPNDLGPAIDLGMPRNNAVQLAEAVKFAVEHKAIGFDFDNCHGNWSAHGLDYYVLCKALWNPALDVRATIADYCRAAYGPAAVPMQRYHDRLEKISDQVRADSQLVAKSPHAARLRRYYSDEALTALESEIVAAKNAVNRSKDPDVHATARIEMAAESVRYARLVTALLEVAHDKKSPLFTERLAAVEAFLKTKVLTPELAPLHSHRYLRMALAYAEREVE